MNPALTKCRVVQYYPRNSEAIYMGADVHLAAIVARVNEAGTVNLCVIDENGKTHDRSLVPFFMPGEEGKPEAGGYATFMPYQVGQAKNNEAFVSRQDFLDFCDVVGQRLNRIDGRIDGYLVPKANIASAAAEQPPRPAGDNYDRPLESKNESEPKVCSGVEGVNADGEESTGADVPAGKDDATQA